MLNFVKNFMGFKIGRCSLHSCVDSEQRKSLKLKICSSTYYITNHNFNYAADMFSTMSNDISAPEIQINIKGASVAIPFTM